MHFFLAITCDTLTDQNGTVYVDAGAVAGYIHLFSASMCEIGQQLIGVQEVKCQMNGTWDNPAPQCQGDHHLVSSEKTNI